MSIFKACLIVANALCIVTTDSKVVKVLGVVAITLMILGEIEI